MNTKTISDAYVWALQKTPHVTGMMAIATDANPVVLKSETGTSKLTVASQDIKLTPYKVIDSSGAVVSEILSDGSMILPRLTIGDGVIKEAEIDEEGNLTCESVTSLGDANIGGLTSTVGLKIIDPMTKLPVQIETYYGPVDAGITSGGNATFNSVDTTHITSVGVNGGVDITPSNITLSLDGYDMVLSLSNGLITLSGTSGCSLNAVRVNADNITVESKLSVVASDGSNILYADSNGVTANATINATKMLFGLEALGSIYSRLTNLGFEVVNAEGNIVTSMSHAGVTAQRMTVEETVTAKTIRLYQTTIDEPTAEISTDLTFIGNTIINGSPGRGPTTKLTSTGEIHTTGGVMTLKDFSGNEIATFSPTGAVFKNRSSFESLLLDDPWSVVVNDDFYTFDSLVWDSLPSGAEIPVQSGALVCTDAGIASKYVLKTDKTSVIDYRARTVSNPAGPGYGFGLMTKYSSVSEPNCVRFIASSSGQFTVENVYFDRALPFGTSRPTYASFSFTVNQFTITSFHLFRLVITPAKQMTLYYKEQYSEQWSFLWTTSGAAIQDGLFNVFFEPIAQSHIDYIKVRED